IPPSSVYQAATGEMPPMRQGIYGWAANPDQWDEYRARRAISTIAVEEDLDKALVAYANQVVRNQASGRNPTEGIPPEWAQEAQLLAARGVRQAGQERPMGRGFSYTTGMPVYPYHQGEQEALALPSAYFAAGYNPETNLGSKGLQGRILDATPDLANWWVKNDEEPGKRGRQTELYRQKQDLLRQKEEAVRQALDDAPIETMSKREIYDLRQKAAEPYDKQIDEIDAELKPLQEELRSPNASLLQGYAPGEIRQKAITGVLWQAAQLPGKPEWPGDEATNAEKEAYFDALAEWERQREDYVVNALSPTPLPGDLPDQGGPVLASENEARELWWHFQNDYRTPRERARLETLDR